MKIFFVKKKRGTPYRVKFAHDYILQRNVKSVCLQKRKQNGNKKKQTTSKNRKTVQAEPHAKTEHRDVINEQTTSPNKKKPTKVG